MAEIDECRPRAAFMPEGIGIGITRFVGRYRASFGRRRLATMNSRAIAISSLCGIVHSCLVSPRDQRRHRRRYLSASNRPAHCRARSHANSLFNSNNACGAVVVVRPAGTTVVHVGQIESFEAADSRRFRLANT